MQTGDFYQKHLDAVSRSFAFCIKKLDPPFRHWVSLSYLLCRMLDTIEDSNWSNLQNQNRHYLNFSSFLRYRPDQTDVNHWVTAFPKNIPIGEHDLLKDGFLLFEDLHELPTRVTEVIRSCIDHMCLGMRIYSSRSSQSKSDHSLVLADMTDLNRYCYFVAGTVGELLSRLYMIHRPDFNPKMDFHLNAVHFGLFLQKVNLLKDQRVDEGEGRYLVPHRQTLLGSLEKNALGAMNYLLSLPADEKGYRTFCGWSLFVGMASLPWTEKSFAQKDSSKIPRLETLALLAQIEAHIQDDRTLKKEFESYLRPLQNSANKSFQPLLKNNYKQNDQIYGLSKPWFEDLTQGILNPSELLELEML